MSLATVQPAKISRVVPDSIAAEIGFEPGDALISINQTKPRDLIDYRFLCSDEYLELEVVDTAGELHQIEIEKDYDDDLGLEFETALFDGLIQCNNHCPFCFIDQQPQPEVRIRLLKNDRAGLIMSQLEWFQERRLQIHAQVVVCPGINDGVHLERTLLDLASFHQGDIPAVASAAVVPVGLTRFRPSEDELVPVTQAKALEVIEQVQQLQAKFQQQFGSTFAWLADEWFLIARQDIPAESHYEDYPQIGNGVGSIRLFLKQFQATAKEMLPPEIPQPRHFTWVVGNAVEQAFQPLVRQLNDVAGLEINLVALNSEYWGQEITVTGLLTGQDLLSGLAGKDLGDGVLLPSLMLKHEDTKFLDDLTVSDVSNQLAIPIFPVSGVEELINQCLS